MSRRTAMTYMPHNSDDEAKKSAARIFTMLMKQLPLSTRHLAQPHIESLAKYLGADTKPLFNDARRREFLVEVEWVSPRGGTKTMTMSDAAGLVGLKENSLRSYLSSKGEHSANIEDENGIINVITIKRVR